MKKMKKQNKTKQTNKQTTTTTTKTNNLKQVVTEGVNQVYFFVLLALINLFFRHLHKYDV